MNRVPHLLAEVVAGSETAKSHTSHTTTSSHVSPSVLDPFMWLGPDNEPPVKRRELCVLDALYGSKKTRLGPAPTDEEREVMLGRLSAWMGSDLPLDVTLFWGAVKGLGVFPGRQDHVDLWDVLGMRRIADVNLRVKQVYTPGLHINVILQDVVEGPLSGRSYDDTQHRLKYYAHGLRGLSDVLDLGDNLTLTTETARLNFQGLHHTDMTTRGQLYAQYLQAYWLASELRDDAERFRLAEYRDLQDFGWSGTIPQEMRGHYLRRVENEFPERYNDMEFKIQKVCLYLGLALAGQKLGVRQGTFENKDGQRIPAINASFVPFPPGVASGKRLGRVEWKVKDSGTSNKVTPPWTGFGVLQDIAATTTGDVERHPSFIPVNEFRWAKKVTPVTMALTNQRSGKRQEFRSDLVTL